MSALALVPRTDTAAAVTAPEPLQPLQTPPAAPEPPLPFVHRRTAVMVLPLPYLRAWRERAGVSREELAVRADASSPTIARLERDQQPGQPRATASFGMAQRLARGLGVEIDALCQRPPTDDDVQLLVPVSRVKCVARPDGSALLFYVRNLAERRRWRTRLSLPAFAARAGMDAATLAAIECGQQPATLPQVAAIARALRLPVLKVIEYD